MALTDREMQTVFDAFDEDKKGFISTDRFLLLAQEYFGSANREEVKSIRLLEALDPTGSGYINYQAFCQGVKTIQEQEKLVPSKCERSLPPAPALSFSFNIEDLPSHAASDDDTHSNGTSESTFNEYDDSLLTDMSEDSSASLLINEVIISPFEAHNKISHRQVDMNNVDMNNVDMNNVDMNNVDIAEETNHLNGDSSPSGDLSPPLSLKLNGEKVEEQFEDYGENDVGIEIDVQDLSSAMDATEGVNNGQSLTSSPNRRITSKEFATHLYRSSSSSSIPIGPAEEAYGEYAASDGDIMELTDKVRELETQLTFLEKDKASIEGVRAKLKNDNTHLHKHKVLLEEHMQELDQRLDDTVQEKDTKFSQALATQAKQYQQEIANLQSRYQVVSAENDKLQNEISQYRSKVMVLTNQNNKLEAQLTEADGNWLSLSVEFQNQKEEHKVEKEEMEDVIHNSNTMIDNLSRQLETLQADHQTEMERRDALMRSPSIADLPSRFTELKHEVQNLRTENQQLKDNNDELSVQVLNSSVKMGRSLLHKGATSTESFASEMETLSKDEIMQNLSDEKKLNKQLKTYIDKILVKVIEKHPSLLEVETFDEGSITSGVSTISC